MPSVALFIADLSFLLLNIHFHFVAEIFEGSLNISYQYTHLLIEFFKTFKISLSIVTCIARYFHRLSPPAGMHGRVERSQPCIPPGVRFDLRGRRLLPAS